MKKGEIASTRNEQTQKTRIDPAAECQPDNRMPTRQTNPMRTGRRTKHMERCAANRSALRQRKEEQCLTP